jgi:hypothetical protein
VISIATAIAALATVLSAQQIELAMPGVLLTIDHASGDAAPFTFTRVPRPSSGDAAQGGTVQIIDGQLDGNSAPAASLVDGVVPATDDEPARNVFFRAGTGGGAVRIDLGRTVDVATIHTYSWHPGSRAPQVYVVYGSDGADPGFDPSPRRQIDPAKAGWKVIATIDTRALGGGQHGVRIAHASGSLGTMRYLLFICFATETDDGFGNTFYSEIDVIARSGAATGAAGRSDPARAAPARSRD